MLLPIGSCKLAPVRDNLASGQSRGYIRRHKVPSHIPKLNLHWTELHPKDRNGTDENVIFVVFVFWETKKKSTRGYQRNNFIFRILLFPWNSREFLSLIWMGTKHCSWGMTSYITKREVWLGKSVECIFSSEMLLKKCIYREKCLC